MTVLFTFLSGLLQKAAGEGGRCPGIAWDGGKRELLWEGLK